MHAHAASINKPWTLTLLFLVMTLNMLDRQVIYILAQDIKVDLSLTDAELGLLTGTAFGLFKAMVGLPVAWCADRLDRSKMIAAMPRNNSNHQFFAKACTMAEPRPTPGRRSVCIVLMGTSPD